MRMRRTVVAVGLGVSLIAAGCAADDRTIEPDEAPEALTDDAAEATGPTRPLPLTSASETPRLDRSNATVDLGEIIFDTFDGGGVALSEADPATVERLLDAIAPIDAPLYQSASDASAWLTPEDLIVGYVDPAGDAWAYSVRVLNSREIVNDELAGLPVVITYCPLCGSGVVFERELGDTTLSFSNTSALFENDMVMVDRETGTYWWQVAGDGLVGPLGGETLELLPSQTTTFASWLEQHPETQVMARPDGRDYSRDSFANYGAVLDGGRTPFPVTDGVLDDDRLPPSARVVVTTINGESRAWATSPERTVEDELGGTSITITTDGTGARIVDADGNAVPLRSAFWFSVLTIDPDIELGG